MSRCCNCEKRLAGLRLARIYLRDVHVINDLGVRAGSRGKFPGALDEMGHSCDHDRPTLLKGGKSITVQMFTLPVFGFLTKVSGIPGIGLSGLGKESNLTASFLDRSQHLVKAGLRHRDRLHIVKKFDLEAPFVFSSRLDSRTTARIRWQ